MEREIKSISLEYPMSTEGVNLSYDVGRNGVTKIVKMSRSTEPYCFHVYYEIWEGKKLVAELHHYSSIVYKS